MAAGLTTARWRWEEDDVAGALVEKLAASRGVGEAVETRAFLRPIFRWMKLGVHKDGSRDTEVIEKAFAFVDWLVLLNTEGDAARGIPMMPSLQPSYALNTIVTASQRAGSVRDAQRAFDLLQHYGYQPDVFTYTALIDVIARNGDLPAAIQKYEEMRASPSKPNVVTYTTLIRAVGLHDGVATAQCLELLTHARQDGAFDEALFLEALETCARRRDGDVAAQVMHQIATHSPKLRANERFYHAVAQVAQQLGSTGEGSVDSADPVLVAWVDSGVLTTKERECVANSKVEVGATASDGSKTLGCLGHQTSQSVRQAVVHHDITRLISRIQSSSNVNVNDFETLIHQCRKRKWKEDVVVIVNAMRDLATNGWKPETSCESPSGNEDKPIPAQPHLLPTPKTYVSIVDAYLCCGDEPLAWQTVLEVSSLPGVSREGGLYRKFVRGAYLLTNCDHIAELIAMAQEDGITFSYRMGVEVARMFGYRYTEGFNLLVHEVPVAATSEGGVHAKRQAFLEELVKSCAYKQNALGAEETLRSMLKNGFHRSASTETAVFICCVQTDTLQEALATLHHFQDAGLMMRVPVYDSLLREMYFKYTRRGNTFDEASRKVAMKTLYVRRAIFEQAFEDREALETGSVCSSDGLLQAEVAGLTLGKIGNTAVGDDRDWTAFRYWCKRESLACAPLMVAQHVVQVLTTLRNKKSKLAAEQSIRDTLLITSDPCLFLLRAVAALRFLDLTFRSLGKLAKQMLALVTDELPMEERHAEYCVSQLPLLTVHIVKELDDVVLMHRSHRSELLAFCLNALETDNIDKTLGFLMRREELYSMETAVYLAPKLAELFVLGGVVNVIQFFKADIDESVEMRRLFVREVIELESTAVDEEKDGDDLTDFGYTCKTITELKLEHEAEFMPFVLRAYEASRKAADARALAEPSTAPDGTVYLVSPLDHDHVIMVDNDEVLSLAYDTLMKHDVGRLGLDAEWRPDGARGAVKSKCSILQVACEHFVFLFDLVELAMGDMEELFAHLFSSKTIVKLGFALDGDIKRLRWSFPETQCFDSFTNVLDFAFETLEASTHLADQPAISFESDAQRPARSLAHRRRRHKGLSAIVKQVLGHPLLKTQQKSDWERRPLTPPQIAYAALDAYCLLMLQDALTVETRPA